jgi:hypothetical protein
VEPRWNLPGKLHQRLLVASTFGHIVIEATIKLYNILTLLKPGIFKTPMWRCARRGSIPTC